MKKVVAFLLALIMFVAPVTTLVKADVVIGDNNEIIVNENAKILGRKLALVESIPDLLNNGVTNISISNTEDLDSYLEYLWGELGDAVDYLSSGDWVEDIPNALRNECLENISNYLSYVDNRTNFFANLLNSPTTTLLKTYVIGNNLPKVTYKPYYGTLRAFDSLSKINNGSNTPDPPSNYQTYLNNINGTGFWFKDVQNGTFSGLTYFPYYPLSNYTWYSDSNNGFTTNKNCLYAECTSIITANIYSNNGQYSVSIPVNVWGNNFLVNSNGTRAYRGTWNTNPYWIAGVSSGVINQNTYSRGTFSKTGTLDYIFQQLQDSFRNINIYVDGVAWSTVTPIINPTLDIDGFLSIYGDDNLPLYDIQKDTQIDYNQLYQVIYNAIRDNLPISQGDVTYYDSHDTIYSPTIINNYGEDEGDESDLIDTILDYAVIPKFDTAIAQPMRQALTNGVVIMNNSITNVIPNEILLILGACFFLLLFAVVINRMIK